MPRRKQIQFKGLQGHSKAVEAGVVAFCLACIIFVVIAIYVA